MSDESLCARRLEDGTYCDRETDPDEIYCGRHGGADPHYSQYRYTR